MIAITPYYFSTLPWASGEQENQRFKRVTWGALAVTLLLAIGVSLIDLPEQTREEKAKIPPQLARILEAKEPPVVELPDPIVPEVTEPVEPEPEPEPEVEPEPIPEPPPEPIPQEVEPVVVETPVVPVTPEITQEQKILEARETASQAGVLNYTDELAGLRESLDLGNLADTNLTEGAGAQSETGRKLIGQTVDTASAGIDTASLSTTVGSRGTLEGRKTTEFNAPTEGAAALATQRVIAEPTVVGDRSVEEIRKTITQNDSALQSLYRRALRSEPELQGKLTVRLVIAPNGRLTSVTLVDTGLASDALVQRLLARIRLINFGAQDVTTTEIEYTYNFFPF